MENISREDASKVLGFLGVISNTFKTSKAETETRRDALTVSLTKLDTNIKSLATTLGSIFTLLKKAVDTRFENERRRQYAEEENILETQSNLERPPLSATNVSKKGIVSDLLESPIAKAAVAAAAYSMLPQDLKDNIREFTAGMMSALGATEGQIKGIHDFAAIIAKSLIAFAGFNIGMTIASSVATLIIAFDRLAATLGLNKKQKAIGALLGLGAGAVTAGILERKIQDEILEYEKGFSESIKKYEETTRPQVSSGLNLSGDDKMPAGYISLQTPIEEVKARIAYGESKGDYNVVYGGNRYITPEQVYGKPLTELTLSELLAFQTKLIELTKGQIGQGPNLGTSASGKYQITRGLLTSLLERNKDIDPSTTKFTPELQEHLANQVLMEGRQQSGGSDKKYVDYINRVWQGADVAVGNVDTATNRALAESKNLEQAIEEAKRLLETGQSPSSGAQLGRNSYENWKARQSGGPGNSVVYNTQNNQSTEAAKGPVNTTPPSTSPTNRLGAEVKHAG